MIRLVVARAVARQEDARELVECQLAVGHGVRPRAVGPDQRLVRIALGRRVAGREPPLGRGPHPPARHRVEAVPERLTHVAHLRRSLQMNDSRSASSYVASAVRGRAALERPPRRLGREPTRLDRVMDALQRRHVDEPDAVAGEQQPGAWNRLGSATNPPSGIVFAPHCTRSPPSRIRRIRGCVFSCCSSRGPRAPHRCSRGRRPCRS